MPCTTRDSARRWSRRSKSLPGWLPGWSPPSTAPMSVGRDAAEAIAGACPPPGQIANLVVPADVSWGDAGAVAAPVEPPAPAIVEDARIAEIAAVLTSGEPTVLLLGHGATRERGLVAASRIAEATGVKLLVETFPARLERGAGLPNIERLGYLAEQAQSQLSGMRNLVLVGAVAPVSFFAYPGKASVLTPTGCQVHALADLGDDVTTALEQLADRVAVHAKPRLQPAVRPAAPAGVLTTQSWAAGIGALLPDETIIADEGNTSGLMIPITTAGAPRHDVLTLTGGAVGQGLPGATGAAGACPDRPGGGLPSDGSAVYTISPLWAMGRGG